MNSITTRLIVTLTACLAAIFAAGTLLDYRLSRAEILARLRLQSTETITSVITDMENWLEGVESSTLFLARILEQRDYSHAGLEQMLRDIMENDADVFGATIALNPELVSDSPGFAPYYFRRDGNLAYADLASGAYHYRDQAWFREAAAAGKPIWVEPYYDRGGGEVLMTTFAVPVFRVDERGQRYLYAVVTADVSLGELRAYLRRLQLGARGNAILLSRKGIILGSRNEASIMRHYAEVMAAGPDRAAWRDMFAAALAGRVVSRQLPCPDSPGDCALRLGSLQTTGWPVGILYSEEEILAPLREFQRKTLLLGLVTLLLMAIAVSIVARRLTRPLTALARATDDVARGNLDTPLPSVQGRDEVARLVHAFTTMTGDLRRYIAGLEAATASRSRLEGELNAARAIQMSLLPGGGEACETFGPCALWARVEPARSVGGDLYSYFRSDSQLWIAVGDVSDKGVPAALFMARAISLIPQLAGPATDPAGAMARLNDALETGNDNCMFVTLFLGVVNLATGDLQFASAGHTPPTLLREGRARTLAQATGPALGLAPGQVFPLNSLELAPGDRLAVFTDGVEEAFDDQAEMFGLERFNQRLAATGKASPAAAGDLLFAAVNEFAAAAPQSDDIALLLLDYRGRDAPETIASHAFAPGAKLTTHALAWLRDTLERMAIPAGVTGELQLVLEELVTNIARYGQLTGDDRIEVTVRRDAATLALEVADRGIPFNPLDQGERSPLGREIASAGIGGLGVHLVTQLTDRQSYRRREGRNVLQVEKRLGNRDSAASGEQQH